jgi:hypothetical protein
METIIQTRPRTDISEYPPFALSLSKRSLNFAKEIFDEFGTG